MIDSTIIRITIAMQRIENAIRSRLSTIMGRTMRPPPSEPPSAPSLFPSTDDAGSLRSHCLNLNGRSKLERSSGALIQVLPASRLVLAVRPLLRGLVDQRHEVGIGGHPLCTLGARTVEMRVDRRGSQADAEVLRQGTRWIPSSEHTIENQVAGDFAIMRTLPKPAHGLGI